MWSVSWENVWRATQTENIINNENIWASRLCIIFFFKSCDVHTKTNEYKSDDLPYKLPNSKMIPSLNLYHCN